MKYLTLATLFLLFVNTITAQPALSRSITDYEKALQAFAAKEYNEAYIHLKNVLKEDPTALAAKILMGKLLLHNAYFAESVTEFNEALAFGADMDLVLEPLGNALLLSRRYAEILAIDDKKLNLSNQVKLHLLRATAHGNLRELDLAQTSYTAALLLQPQNIEALNGLMLLKLQQGDLVAAQDFLQQSMKVDDKNATTWRLSGALEMQRGKSTAAFTAFETAYQLNNQDPYVMRSYADALWAAGRLEDTQKIIENILTQTPNDPFAILLKSQIASKNGNQQQVKQLLNTLSHDMAQITEQNVTSDLSLQLASGLASYLIGNYQQALTDMKAYVSNSPPNLNAIAILADTLLKLGKEREALKLLEKNETLITNNVDLAMMLCDLYLKNNKTFKCDVLSKKLKQNFPNVSRVDFMLAKTLVARGKIESAIMLLDTVVDPELLLQRDLAKAHLYLQIEDLPKAHELAASLLTRAPDDLSIMNFNAVLLIKKQQWQEAESLLNKILHSDPNSNTARYNKVSVLGATGRIEQALTLYDELKRSAILGPEAVLLYAQLLSSAGQTDQAISELETAVKEAPESIAIIEKLVELHIKNNQFELALNEILRFERKSYSNSPFASTKAQILISLGRMDDARIVLNSLSDNWQNEAEKLVSLGTWQVQAKDNKNAEISLLRALTVAQNKNLPAFMALNDLYLQDKEFDKVTRNLKKAEKFYPINAKIKSAWGQLALASGQNTDAVQLFWQAVELDSKAVFPLTQLYQLANQGIETSKFEAKLTTILSEDPNKLLHRNMLADMLLQQGRLEEAQRHYEYLISNTSFNNLPAVLNNLAFINIENDLEQANKFISRALSLAPQSSSLLDTKGWILVKQGKQEEALTVLRQAFSMNSNDPGIRYHLAYTLHKLGRIEEARTELSQALASKHDFPEKQLAQQMLDSM
jgi:putative PEP-CTERM system TPR-repeat lipoprotein